MAIAKSSSSKTASAQPQARSVVNTALVVLLVAASFLIGTLWTKVQTLEKSGAGGNAAVAGDTTGRGGGTAPAALPSALDVPPITDSDYLRGDRSAKLVLIEYSDLECPFCKRFHPTAAQIFDEYKGQVAWVYRHFPLEQLHPKAPKEAEAAECVGDLAGSEAFWKFVDNIFEVTPANNGLDLAKLPEYAVAAGVDKAQFQTCLDSGRMAERVQAQYDGGARAGVTGTPGNILLNTETGETKLIAGAQPFSVFKSAIDEMLAK